MNMYDKIASLFGLSEGDRVYLSSDITKLAFFFRKELNERFDPVKLLEAFQKAVGEEGTLALPVFSFDFSNNSFYDYRRTKGTTGTLGNTAMLKCGYVRTSHPMHSFAVWGADVEELAGMENIHSFGPDSPFEYFRRNNVKQIMLGTDYEHAMTFVHYVETACNVPYRFAKTFTGIYVGPDGKESERSFEYAARRLDVGTVERFNRIGEILEEKGISRKISSGEIPDYLSHITMLGDSYPVIEDDILNNLCRNIYDFSVPREELFEGYNCR